MATSQPSVEISKINPKKFAETDTSEEAKRSPMFVISLQPLSEKDPFFAEKQNSLDTRNLKYEYIIPCDVCDKVIIDLLDQMIQAARILHLNEIELYFAGDGDFGPFSPRNELESLNYMLGIINSMISSSSHDADRVLHLLQDKITAMISSVGDNKSSMIAKMITTDAEESLFNWGQSHGMRTKLKIAYFEEAGRGVVATESIQIGDIALEIPESLIISENVVHDSDMFDVLKELDGITSETMLLLWSMRERYNTSSKFKIYFDTLPEIFNTGLSFGVDALKVLEGSLLLEELLQAKEHLKTQFDILCPALSDRHPAIFKKELYTWDKYLWACELWYSNSMKVVFTDGKVRTCLIPVAGFLNHSVCPHILHYGRVDPVTKSLKFCVSRPCETGEQCFLSYGNFPNSHLLTFYGFLPKGDNPYDIIPLGFATFLGGNLVTWRSKKQSVVFRSSAEAEYRAMAHTVCEVIWITLLLADLGFPIAFPIPMYCDNRSATYKVSNPVFHERTKHIEIDCHFIRDAVIKGKITTPYISSELQLADIFTKGLPKKCHNFLCDKLDFDAPDVEDDVNQSSNGESHMSAHMVRGTWFSTGDKSRTYGLPCKLLTYLRAALNADDAVGLSYGIPGKDINKEDETAMLETILSIFTPMLDRLGSCDNIDWDSSSWDVKLASEYKDLQKKIVSSIISSCNSGLEALTKL